MVFINEFLPNPIGKDPTGEWIELFNNGSETVDLAGWKLKDASGKAFNFANLSIGSNEYLIFDYKTTKISLNNSDESLFLYDNNGSLVDRAEFSGSAGAGKSLIQQGSQSVFTDRPTPGKPNVFEGEKLSELAQYGNQNSRLEARSLTDSGSSFWGDKPQVNLSGLLIGLSASLILAIFFVIIYKKLDSFAD